MKPYAHCASSYEFGLSNVSAAMVLGELGWAKPTLYVTPYLVGHGHVVARELGMNLAVDPELTLTTEWYIEWQGKKIGTEGA